MKKRIGTRDYDTDKSELICDIEGGKLYRKCSRGREWFAVFDNYAIRPLNEDNSRDKELIKIGMQYVNESIPEKTTIWVDRETHSKLAYTAKRKGISISELVKNIVESVIQK